MNIREKFEKETRVPAYISTGVGSTRPTHHYVEWLEEQLRLNHILKEREQLLLFAKFIENQEYNGSYIPIEKQVKNFLEDQNN